MNLRRGGRDLPGGSSLAQLLAEHGGARNKAQLPRLTIHKILKWADSYFQIARSWPQCNSGPTIQTPGETWAFVDAALQKGHRGLPGGSSLTRLLSKYRGVRNRTFPPRLTIRQILQWADSYHAKSRSWPQRYSGSIPQAPGETWAAVDAALRRARRGLQPASSLPRLLAKHRRAHLKISGPLLTISQVLQWSDAHFKRTGHWPKILSGQITAASGQTWAAVDGALCSGLRGLPGGTTLARLLTEYRGVRNKRKAPRLTKSKILDWADAHYLRTGSWPTPKVIPILGAEGETWSAVGSALWLGGRGLPGGDSLSRLLKRHGKGVIRRKRKGD